MLDLEPIRFAGRGPSRALEPLARRDLPDRGRPRAGELPADLPASSRKRALPLARALQDGGFGGGRPRRHHHDQPVQVADLRLRHLLSRRRAGAARLQAHRRRALAAAGPLAAPSVLIIEYHLWRAMLQARRLRKICTLRRSWSPKRPPQPNWPAPAAGKRPRAAGEPEFVAAQRKDVACIVYSSGTGGRPKGCVHDCTRIISSSASR